MTTTSLVGRQAEMGHVAGLIAGVSQRGGALVLCGEAGIGKSAVLAASVALGESAGMRILAANGVESEESLPYAGLHQLLHSVRAEIASLSTQQREVLERAFGWTALPAPDVYVVALAVLDLVTEMAERVPVLIAVDDAHWLDSGSLDVLTFVARRLEHEPVLLMGAIRDGSSSPLEDGRIPLLRLNPLPRTEAVGLLNTLAPELPASLRDMILREAAGNPLALTELPRSVPSAEALAGAESAIPLTARLERAFGARAVGLPPATRSILLAAALEDDASLGESLAAAQIVQNADLTESDMEPAIRAGLVQKSPRRVAFRHPLMRSAILQLATPDERRATHVAWSTLLSEMPYRALRHRAATATGPDEALAVELEVSAEHARERGGVVSAVLALERAAQLSPSPGQRAERLLRAADLSSETGRTELVLRLLEQVPTDALSRNQRAMQGWILSTSDDGMREEPARAVELANLARSVATESGVDLALRILWSAALRCFWSEPGEEARRVIVGVAESLPVDDDDPRLLAILAYAAPIERGTRVLKGLQDLTPRATYDSQQERLIGSAAVLVGAFDLAARLSAAALAGLRHDGRLSLLARALAAQAWSSARLGDLDVAIPAAEEADRLAQETNQPFLYALVLATEAEIAALRGDYDRCKNLAAEAERRSLTVGARPVLATVQLARGLAAMGQGRYADAYDHLRRMHDPTDHCYQVALRCYAVSELVESAVRQGDAPGCRALLEDLEEIAQTTASPALHTGLHLARALVASDDEAGGLFEVALSASSTTNPFARARAQLAYGEWLRRRRQPAESRAHLRTAREAFDALRLVPWSDRARQELRAAGETSPNRGPDARDQLTAHELHIAQLAAGGLTNKEIGQRLFLSHRTVSSHLHRIFPKLGVVSRAELGNVIAQR
ncbi:helix-turn-helix transcriptional regulator [Nocardioides astragali]|uniref:AAA family ATPase n=1 Tax=Nocardioides astragali TaxID=1776736 RepID=A0ABW2N941_9ACTN|nr:LuxR family transcriptional regulator [Nocardioides astragali]